MERVASPGCAPYPAGAWGGQGIEETTVKVAVIQFPGSNADWDALHALRDVVGADARYVFHKEVSLGDTDAVVIPGGFSYGDYLRPGAIAGYSPIVPVLREFARRGGPVLGICNGFQVLTEMRLLPGALTRNAHLRFECGDTHVRVEATGAFTGDVVPGTVLRLPVAHADGRYQCDADTLATLEREGRIAFRYCTADGQVVPEATPNGSVANIAGVYNEERNVLGLMPHPERASEPILGNEDGRRLFDSLGTFLRGRAA
jgi:phosphoribosylformylglycinamidine synthase subunit PurQ / glutaminase